VAVATWNEFGQAAPELAAFGAERLTHGSPAFLATIRADGQPRVHPVTPVIGGGRLYVFMEPTSPKGRDLRARRWFALHNGVTDTAGTGGEFFISGHATLVDNDDARKIAVAAASYQPADRYILFELDVTEARCNGYGDVVLPSPKRWPA
jgi:hypothetical protein